MAHSGPALRILTAARPLSAALMLALIATACQVRREPAPVGVGLLKVGPPVRLTDRPALSPVAWAPDGEALAFTDGGGVWIAPLDRTRGRERKVTAARHATLVDWSVETGLLAYIDRGAVVVVRPDGAGRRRIPLPAARAGESAFATHLAWAPRGDRLAVAVREPAPAATGAARTRSSVWLLSADGGFRRRIFDAPAGHSIGALGWYPDSLFLFIGIGPNGSVTRLLRWRIAYLDRRTLPLNIPQIFTPTLSPNGHWIAFVAQEPRGDQEHVWVAPADGRGGLRRMSDAGGGISALAWAPASDKVAFARVLDEAHGEVWIADVDGGGRRRVAEFVAEFPDPHLPLVVRWSPDGRALAYGSNSGTYTGHVWIVPLARQ
ncbi:MAG: PD40 domain-containing protein [Armatimonadetes bacterium]|nr:PD40 domain-containing protein [Armatimonadota bacterium]